MVYELGLNPFSEGSDEAKSDQTQTEDFQRYVAQLFSQGFNQNFEKFNEMREMLDDLKGTVSNNHGDVTRKLGATFPQNKPRFAELLERELSCWKSLNSEDQGTLCEAEKELNLPRVKEKSNFIFRVLLYMFCCPDRLRTVRVLSRDYYFKKTNWWQG